MTHLRRSIDAAARASLPTEGVVLYSTLLAAGVSRHMIQRLVEIGHLRRIVRGIYLVGGHLLTQRQLQWAALLRGGPEGCLTARSGLEVRSVLRPRPGIATALTTRTRAAGYHRSQVEMNAGGFGLLALRRADRPPAIETVDGLRLATVGRSLQDLQPFGEGHLLDSAWREAEFRGLLDPDALRRDLGAARRRGASAVAALLAGREILTDRATDLRGKTELPWLHHMVAAGLPRPAVNAPVDIGGRRFFADFLWVKYGVALELDSPDHLTPSAAARDRERDTAFYVAGIDVIRFLDSLALADPPTYVAKVAAVLRRQGWDGTP